MINTTQLFDKLSVGQRFKAEKQISIIANAIEGIDTVETVWQVREALEAAFSAGFQAAHTRNLDELNNILKTN